MNVLDKIKSLLNGFKQGGETMEEADLSKVESALSAKMESSTNVWWSVLRGTSAFRWIRRGRCCRI